MMRSRLSIITALALVGFYSTVTDVSSATKNPDLSKECYASKYIKCFHLVKVLFTTKHKDNSKYREKRGTQLLDYDYDLLLSMKSVWQDFEISLKQENQVISSNLGIRINPEHGDSNNVFDSAYLTNGFYTGRVRSENSELLNGRVHGMVNLSTGVFDGVVHAQNNTYYIEPASRYLKDKRDGCVIFRSVDVRAPIAPGPFKCNQSFSKVRGRTLPINYHDLFYNGMDSQRIFQRVRRHHEFTEKKNILYSPNVTKTCTVHAVADHLFYEHVGSSNVASTLTEIVYHLSEADAVFRSTDFSGDDIGDNIGFSLTNVTIYSSRGTSNYKMGADENADAYTYLDNFSLYDFSQACLAIAFTFRDFDGGN